VSAVVVAPFPAPPLHATDASVSRGYFLWPSAACGHGTGHGTPRRSMRPCRPGARRFITRSVPTGSTQGINAPKSARCAEERGPFWRQGTRSPAPQPTDVPCLWTPLSNQRDASLVAKPRPT
jgi:hypothetical protein